MPAARSGSRWIIAAALTVVALASGIPSASAETPGYVAMGDSFTSGFGLKGGAQPCYRAPGSYPVLADSQLDPTYPGLVLTHLACAGASVPFGMLGPQLSGGTPIAAQLPAAEQAVHTLATMTIGANDVRWMQILKDCADPDHTQNCDELAAQPGTDEYDFDANLAAFRTNLSEVLSRINGWAVRPDLLVGLYDWPFPETFDKRCLGTKMRITLREFVYLQSLLGRLNQAITDAVTAAGFSILDLRALFTGHDVCSAQPWSFPFRQPFIRAFHPNDAGHQGIANAVTAAWS